PTAAAVRAAPVGAKSEFPPAAPVIQSNRFSGGIKDERSRLQHVRQGTRIIFRLRGDLRESHVVGCLDEFAKLRIRHRRLVHPETVYRNAMDGSFFGIMPVRSHG